MGKRRWSPEQIARRLPVDFPDDATMRIGSHEAIYQALFVQGRGALRREPDGLCLRTGRVLRMPRARTRRRRQDLHLSRDHDQPTSGGGSADRAVPGATGKETLSWVLAVRRSAPWWSGTTRFTSAAIPAAHGGPWPRGSLLKERARTRRSCRRRRRYVTPSRARDRLATLPEQLRRSLTWDQGELRWPSTRASRSRRAMRSLFLRSSQPMATRLNENTNPDCCASTSPKGPISACTARQRDCSRGRRPQLGGPERRVIKENTRRGRLTRFLLSANKDRVATTA